MFPDVNRLKHTMEKKITDGRKSAEHTKKGKNKGKTEDSNKYGRY